MGKGGTKWGVGRHGRAVPLPRVLLRFPVSVRQHLVVNTPDWPVTGPNKKPPVVGAKGPNEKVCMRRRRSKGGPPSRPPLLRAPPSAPCSPAPPPLELTVVRQALTPANRESKRLTRPYERMSVVAGVAPAPPAHGPAVAAAAPSPAPEPDADRAADAAGVSPQVEQELRDQVRALPGYPPPSGPGLTTTARCSPCPSTTGRRRRSCGRAGSRSRSCWGAWKTGCCACCGRSSCGSRRTPAGTARCC